MLLCALADDEISGGVCDEIARHLAACPACADELRAVRELGEAARCWCGDVPAPATLGARITAALRAAESEARCGGNAPSADATFGVFDTINRPFERGGPSEENQNDE
jgi:anti-sigma factor RsiW